MSDIWTHKAVLQNQNRTVMCHPLKQCVSLCVRAAVSLSCCRITSLKYHDVMKHLAVLVSDQQGGGQAVRRALCSLTPPLQVQQLVLQQRRGHLVVAADHFGHLWSLKHRQTGR